MECSTICVINPLCHKNYPLSLIISIYPLATLSKNAAALNPKSLQLFNLLLLFQPQAQNIQLSNMNHMPQPQGYTNHAQIPNTTKRKSMNDIDFYKLLMVR